MEYKKYGTATKLFERFERVNKVKLNESVFDIDTLDSKLTEYYNLLKQNQLNINSINTSINVDESFVELVCSDDTGNKITFNFKTRFDEGQQDDVYNLIDGEMIGFTFNGSDGRINIEIDENGLQSFNQRFSNEIVDIISDYVDVENNQPGEALYNEAVSKIDNRTFKPLSINEDFDSHLDVHMGNGVMFEDLPHEYKEYYLKTAENIFRRFLAARGVHMDGYSKNEFDRAVNEIAKKIFIEKSQSMNEEYPDEIVKSFSTNKSDPFKKNRGSKKTKVIKEVNTDTVAGYSNINLPQDNIDDYQPINVGDNDMKMDDEENFDNYQPINVGGFDNIEGGLADGQDISNFNKEQLMRGIEVELEHTNDPKIAVEIAMDHLMEDPEYYGDVNDDPERIAQQHASDDAEVNIEDKLLGNKQIK